jgi:hypothetical protein
MAHKNRSGQTETERRQIEEFRLRKGINGSVEYGDAPDAVLLVEGRRIGLEHCELTEQVLAANRPNISALESALRNELVTIGLGQDFSVGIGVNAAAPLFRKQAQVTELAGRLARLAFDQASALSVGAGADLNAPALAGHGFKDILCVNIKRFQEGDLCAGPHVFVTPGICGPGRSSARAAVQAKERRLAAYKGAKNLKEVWLLLVTGESWVQATNSVMTEYLKVATTFDAVYLMDTRTGSIQRLDENADE